MIGYSTFRCVSWQSHVWAWEESNLRPPNYQFGVLTTELHAQKLPHQIFPVISYLQSHCNKGSDSNANRVTHNSGNSLQIGKNSIEDAQVENRNHKRNQRSCHSLVMVHAANLQGKKKAAKNSCDRIKKMRIHIPNSNRKHASSQRRRVFLIDSSELFRFSRHLEVSDQHPGIRLRIQSKPIPIDTFEL